ncbi:MAG: hypothetical protein U0223_11990 [Nitrospira sp.]|nr:hypothetical protein [Nitrospira sp.]
MKLVKVSVMCLLAVLQSSCFFGATVQVFSKKDLSPISKPRLQVILEAYPSIVSAEPMFDNTVKVSHKKHGEVEECDLGFIYLEEPQGYFILTNMSPNCTLWKSNPRLGPNYNYIVMANVETKQIKNRPLRDDVARTTQTVVWPYGLRKNTDHKEFQYLLKKYNLKGKTLGEMFSENMSELRSKLNSNDSAERLAAAMAKLFIEKSGKPEGKDGDIFVFSDNGDSSLGKDQLLGFFRDAIRYGFFMPKDSPAFGQLAENSPLEF